MYYGPTLALDRVSFSAKENEVVGLLGPNGAGKTTLMRILTTFIYPTYGTAEICGVDITQDPVAARRVIGYLPETPPLYTDMRVDEYINFVGRSRGLSGDLLRKRREWVIEAVKIAGVWKHLISELSLGYRQRVGLAQALIHDPKVVILDEPTSGLDPMQIVGIRHLIKELAKEKTIVFSTHILQEASAVSDRLMIIAQGKIIAQGTIPELKKQQGPESALTVTLEAPRKDIEAAFKGLASVKSFTCVEQGRAACTFAVEVDSYDAAAEAIDRISKEKGWVLKELASREPSLEEVFLSLFKKEPVQEGAVR
jgi:ABC-2 type transport system ATP-binding protein